MSPPDNIYPQAWDNWICPTLTPYWQIGKRRNCEQFVLKSPRSNRILLFSAIEGYILRYFNGCYAVRQIQTQVEQTFPNADPNLVINLISRLMEEGILAIGEVEEEIGSKERKTDETDNRLHHSPSPLLKPTVKWHYNPDGYWLLRNSEDRTFIQVCDRDKAIIDRLGRQSSQAIVAEFSISSQQLQYLLQLLTATGMLEGTQPLKRQRGKFNPLQLLFFKLPLFNPDPWLNRHIERLRWMWTGTFAFLLAIFLIASLTIGLNQREAILTTGQQLMQSQGASFFIPFALLSMFVVTLHELGHAFTLKQYGRQVPEVGLLLMCLFPAAYTDTTDQYCLSRRKRILVVAAGVLVQVAIAAIALFFWNLSVPGSWLHTTSYLLMMAALFTIAVNLNPLAKFDGYYLAVAVTGINNLRSRAFGFYANFLTGKPLKERAKDCLILAIYAPFSLFYIWFVFGFLFYRLADWTLINIPAIALILAIAWLVYYFSPQTNEQHS